MYEIIKTTKLLEQIAPLLDTNKLIKYVSVQASFQQGLQITAIMVIHIGFTEGQPHDQNNLSSDMYKRPNSGKNNQNGTHLHSHYCYIVQGLTDGHIVINSHEDKKKYLHAANKCIAKTCVLHSW
jgi:hypothetical protein